MKSNAAKAPESLLRADISKPPYYDFFFTKVRHKEQVRRVNIYYSIISIIRVLRHVSEEMWRKIERISHFKYTFLYSRAGQEKITRNPSLSWLPDCDVNHRCCCLRKINDNFHDNGTMFSIAVVHIMN